MNPLQHRRVEGTVVGFFDEPIRPQLAEARPRILDLLRQYCPDYGSKAELLNLADRYLQLNPDDTEVRRTRDKVAASSPGM